jgi:hypothetical protein
MARRGKILGLAVLGFAVTAQRAPFDVAAKLQVSGGEKCPCVTVRFTNLGPDSSSAFSYQVVQYRWLASEKRYETGVALNTLREGAVLRLKPAGSRQNTYFLKLDSGSTYLLKLEYTPALLDGNNANHNLELKYSFP